MRTLRLYARPFEGNVSLATRSSASQRRECASAAPPFSRTHHPDIRAPRARHPSMPGNGWCTVVQPVRYSLGKCGEGRV